MTILPARWSQLARKATILRDLHLGPGLLLLPNIWDPLGARLLAARGFPAVATASAAVAYSLGYDDGERITFKAMLAAVQRIAAAVDVPVTADMERGYAASPAGVARNALRIMQAGAVGINLEDSHQEGGPLRSLEEQCERIAAVRAMADAEGIPMVINARTDLFLAPSPAGPGDLRMRESIARGRAYAQAGADCLYPIGATDPTCLQELVAATGLPINVYARQGIPSLQRLQALGVRRLSLGPNLLRAALHAMDLVLADLQHDRGTDRFGDEIISSTEIQGLVRREKMTAGDG